MSRIAALKRFNHKNYCPHRMQTDVFQKKKNQSDLRKTHEISFMFAKQNVNSTSQMWELRHRRMGELSMAVQIYKSSDLASIVPA